MYPEPASQSLEFSRKDERLFGDLPSRWQCAALYRSYMVYVNSVFTLLCPSETLERWHEFWAFFESDQDIIPPRRIQIFVPLLYAILYAGAVSCTRRRLAEVFPGESKHALVERINHKVIVSLRATAFLPRPHMPGLIAYAIVETMGSVNSLLRKLLVSE